MGANVLSHFDSDRCRPGSKEIFEKNEAELLEWGTAGSGEEFDFRGFSIDYATQSIVPAEDRSKWVESLSDQTML